MRTYIMVLLTVIVGLFTGFVLLDLAGILLSGHAAEAGAGRILVRLVLLSIGTALIAAILRRESR